MILFCVGLLLKGKRILLNGSFVQSVGQDVNWRCDLDWSHPHPHPNWSTSSLSSSLPKPSVALEEPTRWWAVPASSSSSQNIPSAHWVATPLTLLLFSNTPEFFHGAAPSSIPISNVQGCSFSTSSPIPVTACLFDYNHPAGCKVIFQISICIFLMARGVEPLFLFISLKIYKSFAHLFCCWVIRVLL